MEKPKKWLRAVMASILAVVMLCGSSLPVLAADQPEEDSLKIAVLSDTHYLSPTMIKDTEDYTDHLNSDRKMFSESSAILDKMLADIKQDRPDVLMISGDLTKDGEKEGHQELAQRLERLKAEIPGLDIYVVPGNHDVRNSNAMNFNTEDGNAVPAGRTEPEDFKEIYRSVYQDESVIATYTPPTGKEAGGLSYVARPKKGYTIIAIDSARYSADHTDSGLNEHETSGAISPELEQWVLKQIEEAKERGDTVIGLQHHGLVAHFSMEPDILPMYLVNDYQRLSEEFADAGMQYVFTGHMHANDIATLTTEAGNTLYDIETGSVVTYPSPFRYVTITRSYEDGMVNEQMSVNTKTHLGPITFTNPLTGETQTIEDVSEYGRQHGFSQSMLTTTVNGFLHDYYAQIAENGGIRSVIEDLASSLTGMELPIDKLIDVGLPMLLPDKDSGESIYYDVDEGGIVIKQKVSILNLNVVIPTTALKQTVNILLDQVDNELNNPDQLDAVVDSLVSNLISIQVTEDKTLLDYVNFIYQSHLGGEDSQEWPGWVMEATARIENGALLDQVVDAVIQTVSDTAQEILQNLPLQEVLGANAWNNATKTFIALEGRTPLIRPLDQSGENSLSLVLGILGAKWPTDPGDRTIYRMPEGSNPEVGYSIADFLNALSKYVTLDIPSILDQLVNGTPADPETGAGATEGLLTTEIRNQMNAWLLGLVNSMGKDNNYTEDNHTTIAVSWRLADRSALNDAIAKAEAVDVSDYTEASVKLFQQKLAAAKGLPGSATQSEVDQALQELQGAIDALEKDTAEEQKPSTPDGGSSQAPDNTGNSSGTSNTPPTTGDGFSAKFAVVALACGAMTVLCLMKKQRKSNRS